MRAVGLIVNPLAGMGGKVGLKGTDGTEIALKAYALGARPEAGKKAVQALEELKPLTGAIRLITCPGAMGEEAALSCGFNPELIDLNRGSLFDSDPRKTAPDPDSLIRGLKQKKQKNNGSSAASASSAGKDHKRDDLLLKTGPADTEKAARIMVEAGVDLLLFAGGDGTARNVYNVLGEDSCLAVIGIPAGVKIHSAVYAVNPRSAGRLAAQYLQEGSLPLQKAEVMDIDEEAFRSGRLSARLYGYLNVPSAGDLMQHLKVGGGDTEETALAAIADHIVERMEKDTLYIIGPGSTTGPIMHKLGLENTLLGVDLVENGRLIADDVNEKEILEAAEGKKAKIIVTVIGGQGYLFGRGNQQISAEVIKGVGRENVIVVALRDKILSLDQPRLLVDTGDDETNMLLKGYMRIITGYGEELIYQVSS